MGRPRTPLIDLATHPCKFVRPHQLASYIGMPIRTIYYHIEKGALSAQRIGGRLMIPVQTAKLYIGLPTQ